MFRSEDYARESNKRPSTPRRGSHGGVQSSPKTKLPTQTKSKKCSLCKIRIGQHKIQIAEVNKPQNFRLLCQDCFNDWKRSKFTYSVNFEKASKITE